MFKNAAQRIAFFSAMKKKGMLNNPSANAAPKAPKLENIGSPSLPVNTPPAISSAQNALNEVTGKFPTFGNLKKLMKIKS